MLKIRVYNEQLRLSNFNEIDICAPASSSHTSSSFPWRAPLPPRSWAQSTSRPWWSPLCYWNNEPASFRRSFFLFIVFETKIKLVSKWCLSTFEELIVKRNKIFAVNVDLCKVFQRVTMWSEINSLVGVKVQKRPKIVNFELWEGLVFHQTGFILPDLKFSCVDRVEKPRSRPSKFEKGLNVLQNDL